MDSSDIEKERYPAAGGDVTPRHGGTWDAAGSDLPSGKLRRTLAKLDPGYFALVMATGIVSIGADLLKQVFISRVVLVAALCSFAVLFLAYLGRVILTWPWFLGSLRDPATAMAYFTFVAGTDVLAARLLMAGFPLVALGLGVIAAMAWLVLTYGLPSLIIAGAGRPVLRELNGTWLVWVVATQSLAIVAGGLSSSARFPALEPILPALAICFWGVGVMLYLVLIVVIFLRLILVEVTPAEMGPAYWIAMGATAISARAAAGILVLKSPNSLSLVGAMKPFLIGLSVVLWAFGTWWIPLLVLFGLWRYLVRGYSRAYEPRLWSVVFPLGMYTVASYTLGTVAGMSFMVSVAQVWFWVGLAAWLAVMASMLLSFARSWMAAGR